MRRHREGRNGPQRGAGNGPVGITVRSAALALLRTALADPAASFRPGQWEAIDALANRRERLLVVERTGWGKSAVYFVATRILRNRNLGPALIVSPLLALMRNQIEAAERLGIRACDDKFREHGMSGRSFDGSCRKMRPMPC